MTIWTRMATAVVSATWFAAAAAAQTAPDRIDLLQSEWYADAARAALDRGDRAGAILAALRGIPADPTEADAIDYEAAFDALYMAVVSFAFRADVSVASNVAWSPSGHRALTHAAVAYGGTLSGQGIDLWDPATGRRVAELMPPPGIAEFILDWEAMGGGPFSPDGRLVAVGRTDMSQGQGMQGRIRVFDAMTGAPVAEVAGDVMLGFSASGDMLLANSQYGDRTVIYDTASWQPVLDIGSETIPIGSYISAVAGSDNRFYVVHSAQIDPMSMRASTRLLRLDRGGVSVVVDLTDLPGLDTAGIWAFPAANPQGPQLAFALNSGEVLVLGLDGQRLAMIPSRLAAHAAIAFVRDGSAIAITSRLGARLPGRVDVEVHALDGTPLETRIEDLAPFLDFLAAPDGSLVGGPVSARLRPMPDPWPSGVALYNRIWPQIPEALRAEIDAARIARPE